jgi:hypothetical protein
MSEYADIGVEYVPPSKRISQPVGAHFIRRRRVAKVLTEIHHHPTGRDGQYGAMERRPWNTDPKKKKLDWWMTFLCLAIRASSGPPT